MSCSISVLCKVAVHVTSVYGSLYFKILVVDVCADKSLLHLGHLFIKSKELGETGLNKVKWQKLQIECFLQ